MSLSIQIVNFRSRHYIEKCLFSIADNLPARIEAEILIINNDKEKITSLNGLSKEGLFFRIIELGENIGFGRAHNTGFRESRGEYILFLNPDTIILPRALEEMLDIFKKDEKIGIIGPLLIDSHGMIQPDCFGIRRTPVSTIKAKFFAQKNIQTNRLKDIFEVDWISGGAMLVRRDVFQKVGGFDEKYFMYFEDVDLCWRVKELGYRIVVGSKARVFHESGKSFASEKEKKKYYYASQDYYIRKYFGVISVGFMKLLRIPYYIKNVWLK